MTDDEDKKDGNGPAPTEAPETLSAAEVEELRSAAAKSAEYLDLAKRTKADFINYQSRIRRDFEENSKFAAEGLLRELLPVADDLQRLLASPAAASAPALVEGVRLTEREVQRILAKAGVRPIETAGKKFNPEYHEAAEVVPAPPGAGAGDIVEEVRKGYSLHDRVLRPASVKIAAAPEEKSS
jgi:molecular chaperone GrpE